MRALIVGASGQVGKRLLQSCGQRNIPVRGTAHKRFSASTPSSSSLLSLDITDKSQVDTLIASENPSVVFLCSALTAVDFCETNPDIARRINVEGVRFVAEASERAGARVVFLSTDYVFNGRGGPYSEDDATSPESVYGRTKLEAEKIILAVPASIVARTSVVYDWDPDSVNFAMQMIKRLGEKQPTSIVSDQWSHPTLARNLADILLALVDANAHGVFNTVGPDYVSRYDFTVTLARAFGFDLSLLTSILTEQLKQAAPRPKQCDLRLEKLRAAIPTRLIGIEEGLALVHRDFVAARSAGV